MKSKNYKSLKIVEKIVKRFDAKFPLSNLIENFSLKEKEKNLILVFGITNKTVSFFLFYFSY